MLVCGVICEYDPFHKGHQYLLDSLRGALGPDCKIICAMSGHFTQRGQAALLSKWVRAEMALRCGADVVFELPTLFAVRDAERFALGGVALLDALSVVTHLGFGSESGDLQGLVEQANRQAGADAIRQGLSEGQTFARARGAAEGFSVGMPNNTLAVEYIRSIARLGSKIVPLTVRREGSGHHDSMLSPLASATAIRRSIRLGEDVVSAMPPKAHALLNVCVKNGAYQKQDGLDSILLATFRKARGESLREIADVSEGLENRLLKMAHLAVGREAFLELVKCKRYTWARLSRIMAQTMLGITKDMASRNPLPDYARLLGYREDARPLLALIREQAQIPIVHRAAKFAPTKSEAFLLDLWATDLWSLGLQNQTLRTGRMDMTNKPVCISE